MKTYNNQFALDVYRINQQAMKIGLNPLDPCSHLKEIEVDFDRIDQICSDIHDLLNESSKNTTDHPEVITAFNQLGKDLLKALLTEELQDEFRQYRDKNYHFLHICLDDSLAYIPWELMCLDGEYLACIFNIGRKIRTRQERSSSLLKEKDPPFSMLIITNAKDTLKKTKKESQMIRKILDKQLSETIQARADSRITIDSFFKKIKHIDMIHYAGHSEFNLDNPENSGWKLSDGYFSTFDIIRLKQKKLIPSFVFSNSCQSGRFAHWQAFENKKKYSFGMAHEWMLAGVKHLIATLWEIRDATGSEFAQFFYENLAGNISIGEALKNARIQLRTKCPNDLCWATYVLYGDPTYSYHSSVRGDSPNPNRGIRKSLPFPLNDYHKFYITLGMLILALLICLFIKQITDQPILQRPEITNTIKTPTDCNSKIYIDIKNFLDNREMELSKWIIANRKEKKIKLNPFSSPMLTIIVQFDSPFSVLNQRQEGAIKSQLRQAILKKTPFSCLENENMFKISVENVFNDSLENLLSSQYFLFIVMHSFEKDIQLSLRLVDHTRNIRDEWNVTIQKGIISKQHDHLCHKLIQTLKATYQKQLPFKATVLSIQNDEIIIDVGSLHGVPSGQKFQTLNKQNIFEIDFLGQKQSFIYTQRFGQTVYKGLKLIGVD